MAAKAAEQKRGHTLSFPKWPLRAGSPLDAPEHCPHFDCFNQLIKAFFFACAHRLFYRMNDRIVRFNEPIKEFLVLFLGTGDAHFPGSLIPHGIQLRDERSRTFHWFVSASSAERWW